MKATLIGTDFLQQGDSVKILEINTNTAFYESGLELLDFTPLFETMVSNQITEFHYIYQENTSVARPGGLTPDESPLVKKFKELCSTNNIQYFEHTVPVNSITVPLVEDSDDKFILRQAYDTSALIDSMYTADKFEFFDLIKDAEYAPKTYFKSGDKVVDTLTEVDYSLNNHPNLLVKHRYPIYDTFTFPLIANVQSEAALNLNKSEADNSDTLVQEFIFDEKNLVDGRYSTIRSFDVIYDNDLKVINLGGYTISSIVELDHSENTFREGTREFNNETRLKYITKNILKNDFTIYHTDANSDILLADGTLSNAQSIETGSKIKTVEFDSLFQDDETLSIASQQGTLELLSSSLNEKESTLISSDSKTSDFVMIEIELDNGEKWLDTPGTSYYIEEVDSMITAFEAVNMLKVGDKLLTYNKLTGGIDKKEIVGLQIKYAENITIYGLDFEPIDHFLVDINNNEFLIMHNPCNYCGYSWAPCGSYWCDWGCGGCSPGFTPGMK